MIGSPVEWQWESEPTSAVSGWYAVVLCWDNEEGMFPSASLWNGSEWEHKSVVAFAGPFENEQSANTWACEHCPEE